MQMNTCIIVFIVLVIEVDVLQYFVIRDKSGTLYYGRVIVVICSVFGGENHRSSVIVEHVIDYSCGTFCYEEYHILLVTLVIKFENKLDVYCS